MGQSVKVDINLRGREWESPQGEIKYFNSIQGWRIEKLSESEVTDDIPPVPNSDSFDQPKESNNDEPDDLPF
mgnify:FL=1